MSKSIIDFRKNFIGKNLQNYINKYLDYKAIELNKKMTNKK